MVWIAAFWPASNVGKVATAARIRSLMLSVIMALRVADHVSRSPYRSAAAVLVHVIAEGE
jgi:hypothetical protein